MDKKLMSISTSMMVLRLLETRDMYGYQVIKALEEASNQVFCLKEGTLYPILHNLETEGCIEGYEQVTDTGRIRKYYKITKDGKVKLDQKQREWDTYQKAVNQVMGGDAYAQILFGF